MKDLNRTVTSADGINNIIKNCDLETATCFSHLSFIAPFIHLWIVRFNTP